MYESNKIQEKEHLVKDGERLDLLCKRRWIIQRIRGHKATSDDQLLAWATLNTWNSHLSTQAKNREISTFLKTPMILELGAGKGTITLLLSAQLQDAYFVGIEAFEQSHELSLRNRKLNQIDDRFYPILGDLRDPEIIAKAVQIALKTTRRAYGGARKFDLICGAPPFMPLGSGILPQDPQRASGRFELRGGVEDYLEAIHSCLAIDGRAIILMDGANQQRTIKAIQDQPALSLRQMTSVVPHPNAAATYVLFELQHTHYTLHNFKRYEELFKHNILSMRARRGGSWSDEYQRIRTLLELDYVEMGRLERGELRG